jgi:hypothetical protein
MINQSVDASKKGKNETPIWLLPKSLWSGSPRKASERASQAGSGKCGKFKLHFTSIMVFSILESRI